MAMTSRGSTPPIENGILTNSGCTPSTKDAISPCMTPADDDEPASSACTTTTHDTVLQCARYIVGRQFFGMASSRENPPTTTNNGVSPACDSTPLTNDTNC